MKRNIEYETGNIVNQRHGANTFSFNVQRQTGFVGFNVIVTQTTDWTPEEIAMFGFAPEPIVHRVHCAHSRTEFGAINEAGQKLIKNFQKVNQR